MTDTTYVHIDLSYMDLMADGDVDMKKTILEMLLEELPEEITKIVSLANTGDFARLKAVCHKLKSTLAFVGNEMLDKTNKDVEKMAMEEKNLDQIQEQAKAMSDYCKLVLRELDTELAKL